MKKNSMIAVLVLVVSVGSAFALHYFSAAEVIKRQLVGLAAEIGKEGQEPTVRMALKMGNVKNAIAASCLVTIPERGYSEALESDLIIQYLIYHRNRYILYAAAFEKVAVAIPGKGQAVVHGTIRVRSQASAQAPPVEKVQQVELALVKTDAKWLVHKVTIPEALVD